MDTVQKKGPAIQVSFWAPKESALNAVNIAPNVKTWILAINVPLGLNYFQILSNLKLSHIVNRFVEMEEDSILNVMMETLRMGMDAHLNAKLKLAFIV